ncbi:MAG TPA: hypothetical protein VGS41_09635 [Chthonomonadales bacterium]|nr:hypothetical protein [Chthonomonadales bacterium]
MIPVPAWWIWASGIYFVLSILWSAAIIAGVVVFWNKTRPAIDEARFQARRITGQVRGVASRANHTAELVHSQTQSFLGGAQSAGRLVTRQARTVGAALTGFVIAARVVRFVRRAL